MTLGTPRESKMILTVLDQHAIPVFYYAGI